jgi:hypothetical protein
LRKAASGLEAAEALVVGPDILQVLGQDVATETASAFAGRLEGAVLAGRRTADQALDRLAQNLTISSPCPCPQRPLRPMCRLRRVPREFEVGGARCWRGEGCELSARPERDRSSM